MKLFGTETKQQRTDRLEAERIAKSNRVREIERQRGYVSELELMIHQTRSRVAELRAEAEKIEKELPARERRLASARERLKQMESGQ